MLKTRPAGISAVCFSVLTLAAIFLEAPPGGTYSTTSIADFVASGHRPLVLAGIPVSIAAALGLLGLVLQVYRATPAGPRKLIVAGAGGLAGVAFPVGLAVTAAVPVGLMLGGHGTPTPDPVTTFMLSQAGTAVTIGVGATSLGVALLAGAEAFPGWLRIAAYVAGVAGLLSMAWFPFLLLLLWGLVAGISLIARRPPEQAVTVPEQTRAGTEEPTRVG